MPGKLQAEIKQSRPFASVQQEAVLALLRTADQVRRRLARRIEPHGVTLQQHNVLRILRGAGPEGLPTLAIGERLIEETPGLTRLLDRLERKRLVRRERCRQDRRRVTCRITPDGLALLAKLDPDMNRSGAEVLGAATPPDLARLIPVLDRIRG